jgi:hypothetical protein
MKFAHILSTVILGFLVGCDDNSYKPVKPTIGSNNNTVESPAVDLCPKGRPTGEENGFVHVDQQCDLLAKINAGKQKEVFEFAFEKGDKIFGTAFTKAQGSGANVGGMLVSQYTRMPRADLIGVGQWANHIPKRATGPNAQSCKECHNMPAEDGAGSVALNVHRDPNHHNDPKLMIQRNTPHLLGQGAMQLLAEEMTADLKAIYEETRKKACSSTNKEAEAKLDTKGIEFGNIAMSCTSGKAAIDDNRTRVSGIAPDLVVRPFEWKKSVAFIRDFMRGAGHNEIGMQGTEIVGKGVDGDGDGVKDELSVGDMTVFSVYMAAQPRPATKLELDKLGLLGKKMTSEEQQQIARGEKLFGKEGADCASCHQPKLTLKNAIFSEPSKSEDYRDKNSDHKIPVNLVEEGVTPDKAITFDLTRDQPDNVLNLDGKEIHLGSLEKEGNLAVVRLYGDLKRHYMGDELAEPIAEPETGHMTMVPYEPINKLVEYKPYDDDAKSTFGTKELWGVACTGPLAT